MTMLAMIGVFVLLAADSICRLGYLLCHVASLLFQP
jgi:hypothetical protein